MPSMNAQIDADAEEQGEQQLGDADPGVPGVEPADADREEELQQPGDDLGAVRVREPAHRVAAVGGLRVVVAVRDGVAGGAGVLRRARPEGGGRPAGYPTVGYGPVRWDRSGAASSDTARPWRRPRAADPRTAGRGPGRCARRTPPSSAPRTPRVEPALREVVAERLDRLLPLGGTDADRSRIGCRHAPRRYRRSMPTRRRDEVAEPAAVARGRQFPFTLTTCRSVWSIDTRSAASAITVSIGL